MQPSTHHHHHPCPNGEVLKIIALESCLGSGVGNKHECIHYFLYWNAFLKSQSIQLNAAWSKWKESHQLNGHQTWILDISEKAKDGIFSEMSVLPTNIWGDRRLTLGGQGLSLWMFKLAGHGQVQWTWSDVSLIAEGSCQNHWDDSQLSLKGHGKGRRFLMTERKRLSLTLARRKLQASQLHFSPEKVWGANSPGNNFQIYESEEE